MPLPGGSKSDVRAGESAFVVRLIPVRRVERGFTGRVDFVVTRRRNDSTGHMIASLRSSGPMGALLGTRGAAGSTSFDINAATIGTSDDLDEAAGYRNAIRRAL